MFFHSMNFSIGKDNEILKESIFKFAQKEIAPLADQLIKTTLFLLNYGKSLVNLGFWV